MEVSKSKLLLLVIILSIALSGSAWAQAVAGMGGISGVVRDSSGATVPGAQVVVANTSKGIQRTMVTTEAGVFSAPALVPSTGYSLTVNMPGFNKWEAKDFEILVGQTVDFKVTLQPAGTATQVVVTGEAPLVETSKMDVSQVVEKMQIDNLPINGRRADTFVLITPAVTDDGTFGLVSFRGIAGGNSFLTDGNDTTQGYYNENAGRTRITTQISQDAVQEFQVLSNGFSAEFGRAMGGVINTVTRSGTNDVHGTAYWYFRNRTLNAMDRYAPRNLNPPEWRHQAGASIGGPIKTDKLFYFGNFEIVKRNFPAINRIINTSFTDAGGNNITASCTATAAQCATAIAFIKRQMDVLVPRTVDSAMGFLKFDWRPTERNSFSFDMNAMHWKSPHGIQTQAVLTNGNALGGNGNSTVETRYGKASWISVISPTLLNEFRVGFFKDRLSDPGAGDLWPIETGGLSISLNGTAIGAAEAYPRTLPSELRFQFVDNVSWTHGAHSAKFGFDTSTNQDYINQLYRGLGGYSYSSLTNFAKDFSGNTANAKSYSNFQQTFGNPIQNFRTSDIGIYAQDVWRISRRLTMNFGLRYEHTYIPQPWMVNPNYPQTGIIPSPTNNFGPRFGLTYMINDKTLIRAGYGLFWARFHGNGLESLLLGNGTFQPNIYVSTTTPGSPVFPNVFPPGTTGLPSGTVNLQFASPDFHNPYTQQGTVAIERQLSQDLALTVSYIWSRGVGIWTQRDVNLGQPGPTVTYIINDAGGSQVGTYTTPVYISANKADSRYGKILQVENGGQSWYNGMTVQLRKRMSHGLTGSLSYTWSHAIDDADMQGASWNIGWNYNNVTTPGNYMADRGSSSLDQRHRAVINLMWQPTFTQSNSAFARYFVNGWQFSAITTLASAHPTTATVNVSGTQFTGVFLTYTTMNGSGGWNRVPFWPVSSLDVDQYYRADARLTRVLPFNERVKLNLMFEAFNLSNTITNTGVNTQAYTATLGVLRPTANLGVGNQSQGFPDGTNARRCQVSMRLFF
ncbi:MAG: TonB-dependent receptor [Acidobacteriia bacterium]|nr:TonB-dependent receptor [Terriglobia bacterium]